MSDIYYTEDHEWIRVEGDTGTVGITAYAQGQLGDIVFVELPEVGKSLDAGDEAAVIDSVKAAAEVYAPVGGEVIEANDAIVEKPGLVNEDAMGDGWFFKLKISDPTELEDLMDEEAYKTFVESLG
jgi:glycine cleavage system H protein